MPSFFCQLDVLPRSCWFPCLPSSVWCRLLFVGPLPEPRWVCLFFRLILGCDPFLSHKQWIYPLLPPVSAAESNNVLFVVGLNQTLTHRWLKPRGDTEHRCRVTGRLQYDVISHNRPWNAPDPDLWMCHHLWFCACFVMWHESWWLAPFCFSLFCFSSLFWTRLIWNCESCSSPHSGHLKSLIFRCQSHKKKRGNDI